MYVTVRRYKDAAALADSMTSGKDEVKNVISKIPGFVSYNAIRDGNSVTSVSVFKDMAGCEESTRAAAEWARENVHPAPGSPEVSSGEAFVSF